MKATPGNILARLKGRRNKPIDTAPVITGEVPAESLAVEETNEFLLLSVAIDRADNIEVKASTRRAALRGMEVLAQTDPERLNEIIRDAGACGQGPLKAAIMALAGTGRAFVATGN